MSVIKCTDCYHFTHVQEAQDERENIKTQFAAVMAQKNALDAEQRKTQESMNEVKLALSEIGEKKGAIIVRLLLPCSCSPVYLAQRKVDEIVEVRMNAQNEIRYMKDKLQDEQKKVDAAEEAVKVLQVEFEVCPFLNHRRIVIYNEIPCSFKAWTNKASEYCQQVPNPRKAEEVQRRLDSLEKALKERERK